MNCHLYYAANHKTQKAKSIINVNVTVMEAKLTYLN